MPNYNQGVGLFTTANILAVLRAIPETTGTYAAVAAQAQQHRANLAAATLSNYVTTGRTGIRDRRNNIAYARVTRQSGELIAEHCGPYANATANSRGHWRS